MAQATTADIDFVRLLCGDTEQVLLSDSQVLLLLNEHGGDRYAAAAACADAIAASVAGRVDVRVGILSSSDSQLQAHYRQLADDLRARSSVRVRLFGAPFAGGVRAGDKAAAQADDSLVRPIFIRNLHGADGSEGEIACWT